MGEFPPSKLAQNTFKFTFKMSFWALFICVFVYISIFYLFNLSPRVLFNTNKFWFLISNTLIIIIAADSGAFSSSKYNNPDPPDQLVVTPHYNFRAIETPNKYNIGVVQEKGKNHSPNDLQKATIIVNEAEESKEKSQEIVVQERTLSSNHDDEVFEDKEMIEVTYDHKEEVTDQAKSCQASKSERAIRIGGGDEDDKNGAKINTNDENDKFSSMSDEELNKRVEEFIRRFYNQQLKPQRRRKIVSQV